MRYHQVIGVDFTDLLGQEFSARTVSRPALEKIIIILYLISRSLMIHQNLKLFERLRDVGARHGRFAGVKRHCPELPHPAVIGARSSKQVDGIIGALDFRLTPSGIAK